MDHLNTQHSTIKFTAEVSQRSVNFLDTTITLESDGSLSTNLYRKPTDTFQYLHYRSFHPNHQKQSIPYSQFVRVRRICTHKKDYFTNTDLMIRHFITRGYPMKLLIKAQKDAAALNRVDLLKQKPKSNVETIPFITTYSPAHQEIKSILNTSLFLLDNTRPQLNQKYKFMVTARRCPNLRDLLTKSKLPNEGVLRKSTRGSSKCDRPRCTVCKHVKTTTSVTSRTTKQTIHIPINSNCISSNLIYIIECSKCGIQYVGQTSNTLTTRLRQHLRDIRLNNEFKAVSNHFNSTNHNIDDVTIYGVDSAADLNARLRLEEAWIHVTKTVQPQGLNHRF